MKRLHWLLALSVVVQVLVACDNGQFNSRDAGALGGAAIGAGLGAIVGHQTGHAGAGIAIGSAIGAVSGGLIGNSIDNQNDALTDRARRLEEQDRQLLENRRLIDDLRRGGADARETDRGVVVNLPDVLFDFDKASLTREARDTVEEIARVARSVHDRRIAVEGHTDSVGAMSYNQKLSEDRAHSVGEALARAGIPKRQMAVRGYGETRPTASNNTESGRRRNRRVEVIIENR